MPTFAKTATMGKLILIGIVVALFGCAPTMNFNKDKAAFKAAKLKQQFTAVADMNDAYFELKENNYFEFYRQLFDSVKNTSYPGKYTINGDTLYLKFYNNRGVTLLGNKATVKKGVITFYR